MDPAAAIDALLLELKRQKAEGVRAVNVSEESLLALRQLAGQPVETSAKVAPSASPTRSAAPATSSAQVTPAAVVKPVVKAPVVETIPAPPVVNLPTGSKSEQMAWLHDLVKNCAETKRHFTSQEKLVWGEGSLEAKLFLIGEAPSLEEVEAGRPFIGASGELLERILKAAGIERSSVYLAPVMGWRPEPPTPHGKRPPTVRELAFNLPYLKAQLEIVRPKVVVALGAHAHEALMGRGVTITQARGQWTTFAGMDLMPTYHPNYLLHNPSATAKRVVWEDFLLIMEKLGLPISDKQRAYFTTK